MYLQGQGIVEDKEEAIRCYEKAVELGNKKQCLILINKPHPN